MFWRCTLTDKQFQKLLDRLHNAHYKYQELLKEAEEEYKNRYGCYPGDWDDNNWIDKFHINAQEMTINDVLKGVELSKT